MTHDWPLVRMEKLLTKNEDWLDLEPTATYKEVTVRLWGKGVTLRREVTGAEIAADRRVVVRAQQFILSRIDARNGAFGLVPVFLDGAVVSTDFPAFKVNTALIVPEYLEWMSKTAGFVDLCKAASEGTTNRVRLKEDRFLATEIPLPLLDEQRRLVARIEALAAKIEEARELRRLAVEEAEALSRSMLSWIIPQAAEPVPLLKLIQPGSTISYGVLVPGNDVEDGVPFVRVQDLDVRNPTKEPNKRIDPTIDAQYKRTRLHGGEVLIGVVGSIGKVGLVPESWVGANIARAVCRIVPGPQIDRYYLAAMLMSSNVQTYLKDTTRTLAQPTLNVRQLEQTPIPLIPIEEQRRIVAYLDGLQAKVDALKQLQAQTQAELDALLPSVLDRAFRGEL